MKIKIILSLLLLSVATVLTAATNDLTTQLQQGLFDEEANRDLNAAIADYQSLATQFDRDRQVAATAIYRLGECYRKLGQTSEATREYQRLIRDFADQTDLVTLSRQNLTGLGTPASDQSLPPLMATRTQHDLLADEIKVTEQELAAQKQQVQIGTLPLDGTLPTQQKLLELRRQLAALEGPTSSSLQPAIATPGDASAEAKFLAAQLAGLAQFKDNPEKYAMGVQAMFPDDDLGKMLVQLSALKDQEISALAKTNAPFTLTAIAVEPGPSLLEDFSGRTTNIGDGPVLARLETQKQLAYIAKREDFIISLQQARLQILQSGAGLAAAYPGGSGSTTVTDEESQEIVRIQQMIRDSPDLINAPAGDDHRTPLARAAAHGWLKVATYLLDHGADVNGGQNSDLPALYRAAEAGNRAMVELLISRGADVNAGCPLAIASKKGFLAVVEVLLMNKADVNVQDSTISSGDTPLGQAAIYREVKIVQQLLAAGANPNLANRNGQSPLSYAAANGSLEIVKLLLAAKADPNSDETDVPLLGAIHFNDLDMAERLLQAGANANAKGKVDWRVDVDGSPYGEGMPPASVTPLWLAVCQKQLPMAQLLLKYHADPNDNQTDAQPLTFDALRNPDLLETLLKAGAKANALSPHFNNYPLLITAVDFKLAGAMEVLLKHGADPDIPDGVDGSTPLHYAAAGNPLEPKIFDLLLSAGANPNVRNNYGVTPLDLLKAKTGQPSAPDQFGNSTMQIASSENATLAGQLADLLRKHGALDHLPDWGHITASRTSANYLVPVFSKGTNDWNQFTLLEFVAVEYQFLASSPTANEHNGDRAVFFSSSYQPLPFPNLNHLQVHRPSPDLKSTKDIAVNFGTALQTGDDSHDIPLQWGDVVDVPAADHPLNEEWPGFSDLELANLKKCLTRHVTVIVNGRTNLLTLAPQIIFKDLNGDIIPAPANGRTEISRTPFWLGPVLLQSQLVLASSDLSHVKVTRRDPSTGRTSERIFDCSQTPASSGSGMPRRPGVVPPQPIGFGGGPRFDGLPNSTGFATNDLWLRDGDVIEVPER